MENNTNTVFVSGIYLNKVSDSAPSFIITNQSIHLETLYKWIQENKGLADEKGYVKIVGKESKEGKRYFQVDSWKPTKQAETPAQPFVVPAVPDITAEFTGAVPSSQLPPF